MEVLERDVLLRRVFGSFLALEVWSVQSDLSTDNDFISWCIKNRWYYFTQSRLFCEYKLCQALETDWTTYERLRDLMDGCRGSWLLEAWLSVEAGLPAQARALCSLLHSLSKLSSGQALQRECVQRLKSYWLPRAAHGHTPRPRPRTPDVFVAGLRSNSRAGKPFNSYLTRTGGPVEQLLLWDAIDEIVLSQRNPALLGLAWRNWEKLISRLGDAGSVGAPNNCSVNTLLITQGDLLSTLKRHWTAFRRSDHDNYHKRLGVPVEPLQAPVKRGRGRRAGLMRPDQLTGPLAPLGDLKALFNFEHFLFTVCGPRSQENLNYQLWKHLKAFSQTASSQKRESLISKIQHTFLYSHSDKHVDLPSQLLEDIDAESAYFVPPVPVLTALQCSVSERLAEIVRQFMEGTSPQVLVRGSKVSSHQAASAHLLSTLEQCRGPISRQLSEFGRFLALVSGQLSSDVQFWLEASKFKAMAGGGTDPAVLSHKAEALVDSFLDTPSPPWIRVTVSEGLVAELVRASGQLLRAIRSGALVTEHVRQLELLLGKAQGAVLVDMSSHWSGFLEQYTTPTGSWVSIPPVVEESRGSASVCLPALPDVPLLSYSSHRGLQWNSGPL